MLKIIQHPFHSPFSTSGKADDDGGANVTLPCLYTEYECDKLEPFTADEVRLRSWLQRRQLLLRLKLKAWLPRRTEYLEKK